MKKFVSLLSVLGLLAFASGCATTATTATDHKASLASRAVTVTHSLNTVQILQAAIEAAKDANLPPATTVDNAAGVAYFTGSASDVSAQVTVLDSKQIQILFQNPKGDSVDKQADNYTALLDQRLKSL